MARKYLFADESGNFDFKDHTTNRGATRYFAVGTILFETEEHRIALQRGLDELRYEMIHDGLPLNGAFHATEDRQVVRDGVFEVLGRHEFIVDVTILEKAKAQPQIRRSDEVFYQFAWYFHLKHFARQSFQPDDDLTVICATLGTKKRQKLFREAVENVVTQCCPDLRVKRRVVQQPCATDVCLQAADYALWAVMRDVERGDDRPRGLIEDKIRSNFQLFGVGTKYYYGPKATRIQAA